MADQQFWLEMNAKGESSAVADQLKWQEMNVRGSSKKSMVFKTLAIVILVIVLLVANDFVYYRFLDNSNGHKNSSLPSFDEDNSTRTGWSIKVCFQTSFKLTSRSLLELADLDRIRDEIGQLRAAVKGIQKQIKNTRDQVQTNFSEVHFETDRINSDLQSANEDLSEVEKQISNTMIQQVRHEEGSGGD